jgi:hypothetical protein
MALGATAADVLRRVLSHGLVLSCAGILLGGIAVFSLTRLVGYLLYRVSPRDPLSARLPHVSFPGGAPPEPIRFAPWGD